MCVCVSGEEAVKAKNSFYYLTYQGSIDLDSTTTDPQLRKVCLFYVSYVCCQ